MKKENSQSPEKKRPVSGNFDSIEEVKKLIKGESTKKPEKTNKKKGEEKRHTIYSNKDLEWGKSDKERAKKTWCDMKKERRKGMHIEEESTNPFERNVMSEESEDEIEEIKGKEGEEEENNPFETTIEINNETSEEEIKEKKEEFEDKKKKTENKKKKKNYFGDPYFSDELFPLWTQYNCKSVRRIIREPEQVVKIVMPNRRQKTWVNTFNTLLGIYFFVILLLGILHQAKVFTKPVSEDQPEIDYYFYYEDSKNNAINTLISFMYLFSFLQMVLVMVRLLLNLGPNEKDFQHYFEKEITTKINAESSLFIHSPELEHFCPWIEDHQALIRYLAYKGYWCAIANFIKAVFEQFNFNVPILNINPKDDGEVIQHGTGEHNKFNENCYKGILPNIYEYFTQFKQPPDETIQSDEYRSCLLYFLLGEVVHQLKCLASSANLRVFLNEFLNDKIFLKKINQDKKENLSLLLAFLLTKEDYEKGKFHVYQNKIFKPKVTDKAKEVFSQLNDDNKKLLKNILIKTDFGKCVEISLGEGYVYSNWWHHSFIPRLRESYIFPPAGHGTIGPQEESPLINKNINR